MEGYPEFLENFKSIKIILPLSTGTLKPYCDFPLKQLDSSVTLYQFIDSIRSHPETLLPLEKPLQPPLPVSGKPQNEFILMASMGNMLHAARNVMPIRSGHPSNPP